MEIKYQKNLQINQFVKIIKLKKVKKKKYIKNKNL